MRDQPRRFSRTDTPPQLPVRLPQERVQRAVKVADEVGRMFLNVCIPVVVQGVHLAKIRTVVFVGQFSFDMLSRQRSKQSRVGFRSAKPPQVELCLLFTGF